MQAAVILGAYSLAPCMSCSFVMNSEIWSSMQCAGFHHPPAYLPSVFADGLSETMPARLTHPFFAGLPPLSPSTLPLPLDPPRLGPSLPLPWAGASALTAFFLSCALGFVLADAWHVGMWGHSADASEGICIVCSSGMGMSAVASTRIQASCNNTPCQQWCPLGYVCADILHERTVLHGYGTTVQTFDKTPSILPECGL